MNSTGGTAAEAMDVGESTGIQCPPELVLREERSGELLWIDGMDGFEFEKGGGKAVARRGRELQKICRRRRRKKEGVWAGLRCGPRKKKKK